MSGVLVLGGSLPALAAALEFAEVGIEVWIASPATISPQGTVRDSNGEVARLLEEVAAPLANGAGASPDSAPVRSHSDPVRLTDRQGGFRLPPAPAVWGIPAVALSGESIAFLGTPAALRVYFDRLKPVLTIGKQENLARLVESRIGALPLRLLVEPLVFERFGVRANEAEVSLVAPGLDEAITRAGSLTGGAAWLLDDYSEREAIITPASGWGGFGERLRERLALYGAQFIEAPEGASAVDWDSERFDAVIVDAEVAGDTDLLDLQPARVRVYAEIGIDPVWETEEHGQSGSLMLQDGPGGVWAVRIVPTSEHRWIAQLAGPSVSLDDSGAALETPKAAELCEWFGFEARGDSSVRISAAPYAVRAEREASEMRLDDWHEAHPNVLACGETLHGDSLGAAIADARHRATSLRRRILGIAE